MRVAYRGYVLYRNQDENGQKDRERSPWTLDPTKLRVYDSGWSLFHAQGQPISQMEPLQDSLD